MALQGGDAMQTAYCLGQQQAGKATRCWRPSKTFPYGSDSRSSGSRPASAARRLDRFRVPLQGSQNRSRLRKPHPYWPLLIVGMEIGLETYAVIHDTALFPPSGGTPTATVTLRRR
jgi:hypothetical protein